MDNQTFVVVTCRLNPWVAPVRNWGIEVGRKKREKGDAGILTQNWIDDTR